MCNCMFKLAFFFSWLLAPTLVWAAPHKLRAVDVIKAPVVASPAKILNDARLAYEAGKWALGVQLYERLASDTPEYLRSREELGWAYLRQENWLKLRGLLSDLNSKLIPLRWRLEGRVLSAMLYLKDCQYDKVRSEMALFQAELQPLAHLVDSHSQKGARLAYWRALHDEINEAIFKMKFVRMELRSRLVMLTRQQIVDTPDRQDTTESVSDGRQVYPVDGDIWSDEVFIKRGEAKSVCAALHNSKGIE